MVRFLWRWGSNFENAPEVNAFSDLKIERMSLYNQGSRKDTQSHELERIRLVL